ncbi:MAG: ATP-binding cassette domain-containing protein [Geminicoccaceae bacterium]|nr:ATP-binding cassette domain-containing protein [Geminicoccaceae bacterium]
MPGLRLEGVALRIGGRTLLEGFDLEVAPGTITTLMGPSGCGKSSLLSLICGTLEPGFAWSGSVFVGGRPVLELPPERRRVGILFQDDMLFPHLSVGENLGFALPRSVRGEARQKRIEGALEEAELPGFADRDPSTLSGGQRSRVALLRTLLAEPRALLLDEPFARLDAALKGRIRSFVFDHARDAGLPTLLVTHDPDDACPTGGPVVDFPSVTSAEAALEPVPAGVRRPGFA